MQEQIQWFTRQIGQLDDSARQSAWHLGDLQASRRELAPVWSDSCALEMARRYLDPHAGDAADCAADLRQQIAQLHACAASIDEGHAAFEQAGARCGEVESLIAETGTIFRALDSLVSEVMSEAGIAEGLADEAQSLVLQAAAVGNSA